jgi:hypothetical protein
MKIQLKVSLLTAALSLVACIVGCHKSTEFQFQSQTGQRVAKVGNTVLTVEGLNEELKANAAFWQNRLMQSPENKKQFLETQVRTELMVQEAIRLGYLEKPDVQKEIKRLLVQRVLKDKVNELVGDLKISDEESKKYYDEHSAEFNFPERMRIGYFRVPKGTSDKEAKAKAEIARKQAMTLKSNSLSKEFEAIVHANNLAETTDPKTPNSAKKPVVVGSVDKKSLTDLLGAKVADASFALTNDGDMTALIETEDAYTVVRRFTHYPAATRDFQTAKSFIEQTLISQKRTDLFTTYVEGLKKDLGVSIDENRLAMVGAGDESKKVIESATAHSDEANEDRPKTAPTPSKVMVQPSHSTAEAKPRLPEVKKD